MNLNSKFQSNVADKYQIYNSLFLTLPFAQIADVGLLLPMLAKHCDKGFSKQRDPDEIIKSFFVQYTDLNEDTDKINLLFKFIQYI